MANQIPFDDQVNHNYQINEFDLSVIKTYLNEVKSDLEDEIPRLTINEIARRMNIAEGANEYLLPKNVGLLFFAKNTQRVFPYAKIEIVTFSDESGSNYTEKIFAGNLHRQLKSALDYLKDMVVKEKVVKSEQKAEADRFYNYPYDALEEALCNAVYHRGYNDDSPIEVRIYPSRIDIISFPGPLPPLDKEKLKNNQFDVRKYRNRRIGEFLKELHLTEGRATGIPTIIKALEKNESPKPLFETDDDRTFFKTTFFAHPLFNLVKLIEYISAKHIDILNYCTSPRSREEIFRHLKMSNHFKNYDKYLIPLIDNNLVKRTIPDSPTSPNQKYLTGLLGKEVSEYFKQNAK